MSEIKEFKREPRYAVLKWKEVLAALTKAEIEDLQHVMWKIHDYRESQGKTRYVECVVVEQDWPEYESTWQAIEARMTGKSVSLKDGLGHVRDQLNIQGYSGNWNYDPYMQGMYNGLECALATLEKREPEYKSAPAEWGFEKKAKCDCDNVTPTYPLYRTNKHVDGCPLLAVADQATK